METSKKPPKPKTRRGSGTMQFLTQEELKHLLAVIKDKRDKALFLLAYRHGLRASEIGLLQRTDVDLKQGRITIHRLKGSLSGIYPLQPDVIKLLRAYVRAHRCLTVSLHLQPRRAHRSSHVMVCDADLWRAGGPAAGEAQVP